MTEEPTDEQHATGVPASGSPPTVPASTAGPGSPGGPISDGSTSAWGGTGEPGATRQPAPGSAGTVATQRRSGRGEHVRRDETADNGKALRGRHVRTNGGGPPARHRSAQRWVVEWVVIILIALAVAFGVRTFVAQTFYVPSTSMYPTLKAGDRIVVDKLAFHLHSIDRGDIVVFKTPPAEKGKCGGPPVPDLVKRVIGLPNENISARGGAVYITGKQLAEPWLPKVSTTYTANFGPVHIPAGEYFMMGDNRIDSCDSRIWGPVHGSAIVGKVDLIIWPLSQFRFF